MSSLSSYEQNASTAIEAWKNPPVTLFDRVVGYVNKPVGFLGNLLIETPFIGDAVQGTVKGIVSTINDAVHLTVRTDAILAEFADAGHEVSRLRDIHSLDLEVVDGVVGRLDAKYRTVAMAEGVGTGVVGAWGIPADLVALLGWNMRAIGEYATYYGFDIARQEESLFALAVLNHAASPKDASKQLLMAEVVRLTGQVATNASWKKLNESAVMKIVQRLAESLGTNLTKAKAGQILPGIGAAVGGGYNAYFTGKVCEAAHNLYRERFLDRKRRLADDRDGRPSAGTGQDASIVDAEFVEISAETTDDQIDAGNGPSGSGRHAP